MEKIARILFMYYIIIKEKEGGKGKNPDLTMKETIYTGMAALTDSSPEAMKETLEMMKDPETMREVQKLMQDPEFIKSEIPRLCIHQLLV